MKEQITHVAIVLDKSGSMAGTKNQTINGFNEQIQQIKKNAEDGKFLVSLVTFDSDVYEHFWDQDVNEIAEANPNDYNCGGMTAMYDAVSYTLNKLQSESESNKDKDVAYLVVIISDGEENSSKHINQSALKELVESLDKKDNWTFTYMGCNKQYLEKLSKDMAIPLGNMAAWSNTTERATRRGMSANACKLGDYAKSRKRGLTKSFGYYSGDVDQLADFSEDTDIDVNVTPTLPNYNIPNIPNLNNPLPAWNDVTSQDPTWIPGKPPIDSSWVANQPQVVNDVQRIYETIGYLGAGKKVCFSSINKPRRASN